MLKRIAIYCTALLSIVFIVSGYFWLKDRPERLKAASEMAAFASEETAQKRALESLGPVELDLADLSLARLEQKLRGTPLKQPGARNTTRLGWACGVQRCAIWTSFAVPFNQEIPTTMTAAAVMVTSPLFADSAQVKVGGVHVGESVEEMKKFCQQRGCGPLGKNRISWNDKWSLFWTDTNGKISMFGFSNEKTIRNYGAARTSSGDAMSLLAIGWSSEN